MMAPRKKKDEPTETEQAPKTSQRVTALPSQKLLSGLLAQARKAKQDTGEINGELGAAIKDAADNKHLNKKAFSIVKGLDKMEPEKLADTLEHLDDYLEKAGLRKRAGQVMRMNLGEDGEEDGARTSNVRSFPQPKGEAAE